MPRVEQKTKSKAGEPYRCDQCSEKIVAGQAYFQWKFRYGGIHRQHTSHGRPKESQLTQSKLSGVYSAIESAQMEIDAAEDVDALREALETCRSSVEEVRDEYQESLDNIPDNLKEGAVGSQCQEMIDNLESFMGSLESNDLEDFEEEEPELGEAPVKVDTQTDEEYRKELEDWETENDNRQSDWEDHKDEHLEAQKEIARSALDELSV
jgi:hypothetical protein